MKVVIDTNVVFSALYRPSSAPGGLLMLAIEGGVDLVAPETVRKELADVLQRKLGYSAGDLATTLDALPIEWFEQGFYAGFLPRAKKAIADEDDAPLVALALALGIGVVSGDSSFHPLRRRIVRTWRPRQILG